MRRSGRRGSGPVPLGLPDCLLAGQVRPRQMDMTKRKPKKQVGREKETKMRGKCELEKRR